MNDLSVLIPARNEMFLKRTVEDVLANRTADTEVIVVLDGSWAEPPLAQNERVTVVHLPESIGQRAATNLAARLSQAKYIMKLDAHCSMAQGFDTQLIESAKELGRNVTQIPSQYNLHVFDWLCDKCAKRQYQGPTPGKCECGGTMARDIIWKPRTNRLTTTWRFDSELHFQYFPEYKKRPEWKNTDYPETMSCLGACWFLERDWYWELGGMDEAHGSWGQMGTELGCKSWLSGGRMITNKKTWFAHMFRTQGGDFGFPYPLRGSEVDRARKHSQKMWRENAWPGQVRPLSWLVDHFWPVPGWPDDARAGLKTSGERFKQSKLQTTPSLEVAPKVVESGNDNPTKGVESGKDNPTKGIVYYSDNRGDETILTAVQRQLRKASTLPIVAVTLQPTPFFDKPKDLMTNVVLPLERGYLTMARQILAGLEASTADVIFFCEHDVLYHPSHFEFTPPRVPRTDEFGNTTGYYYNENVWKVDAKTGHALFYYVRQLSGLCAWRDVLLKHFRRRVELIEKNGFNRKMGFEPGTHRRAERVDDLTSEAWMSATPNIDIRHNTNLTPNRWRKDQFRDQRFTRGWTESDSVPGWGVTKDRFDSILRQIS